MLRENGTSNPPWKPWRTDLFPLGKPLSSRHNLVKLGSAVNVVIVGLAAKLWTKLNHFTVVNHESFIKAAEQNYNGSSNKPLLTISNHSSCLDDPVLWGALLPWSWQINNDRHRWIGAADDICFTKTWHTLFFGMGQTFPVERGKGIYQPAIDFAIQLLRDKKFLHCFPQGKVAEEFDVDNVKLVNSNCHSQLTLSNKEDHDAKPYHFKWGVSRLILETLEPGGAIDQLELLPFYHIGMNEVLPNVKPYIPRIMKRVTVYIRKEGSIQFDNDLINWICQQHVISCKTMEDKRIAICKYLEDEVKKLKLEAMKAHWSI